MDLDNKFLDGLVAHIQQVTKIEYDLLSLKEISDPIRSDVINDSPYKYYLKGRDEKHNSVLMISNRNFPDFIDKATIKSKSIRDLVSDSTASVILDVFVTGWYQGLSFAVWPEQEQFSSNKVYNYFQRKTIERNALLWIQSIAKESLKNDLDCMTINTCIKEPIEYILKQNKLSNEVKLIAEKALSNLLNKQWQPVTVAQHCDLWTGNFLKLNSNTIKEKNDYGFVVIDWAGAYIDGIPFFDFIYFCQSNNFSKGKVKKELSKYAQLLNLQIEEVYFYSIIGFGRVGINMEEFPEHRYIEMCERGIKYISDLIE